MELAGAVAAALTVLDFANRERRIGNAHRVSAGPCAAALIVNRVNIDVSARRWTLENAFAGLGANIPPAFSRPTALILVADGDADAARRRVTEFEFRLRRQGQDAGDQANEWTGQKCRAQNCKDRHRRLTNLI